MIFVLVRTEMWLKLQEHGLATPESMDIFSLTWKGMSRKDCWELLVVIALTLAKTERSFSVELKGRTSR